MATSGCPHAIIAQFLPYSNPNRGLFPYHPPFPFHDSFFLRPSRSGEDWGITTSEPNVSPKQTLSCPSSDRHQGSMPPPIPPAPSPPLAPDGLEMRPVTFGTRWVFPRYSSGCCPGNTEKTRHHLRPIPGASLANPMQKTRPFQKQEHPCNKNLTKILPSGFGSYPDSLYFRAGF